MEPQDRAALLTGYVDVVVLRDVIERHAVTNPLALRWMQRQLLANPGGRFSVQKQYDTLRSQGVRVGKDTLHAYLGYLEDAFLVRTVSLHSASERRRMVHARKAYPVDPGLIELFATSGRSHAGRALETVVLLELERLGGVVRAHDGRMGGRLLRASRGGAAPVGAGVSGDGRGRDLGAGSASAPLGRRGVPGCRAPARHPRLVTAAPPAAGAHHLGAGRALAPGSLIPFLHRRYCDAR